MQADEAKGRRTEGRAGHDSIGILKTRDLCHLDFWSSFNSSMVLLKFLPRIPSPVQLKRRLILFAQKMPATGPFLFPCYTYIEFPFSVASTIANAAAGSSVDSCLVATFLLGHRCQEVHSSRADVSKNSLNTLIRHRCLRR